VPKYQVTIEAGNFEVDARDEDEAIELGLADAVVTAELVDDDEEDENVNPSPRSPRRKRVKNA
jgi:hypothetical protein